MATLRKCLDEITDVSDIEKKLLLKYVKTYKKDGYTAKEAEQGAVKDFIKELEKEQKNIQEQINKAGINDKVVNVPEEDKPALEAGEQAKEREETLQETPEHTTLSFMPALF